MNTIGWCLLPESTTDSIDEFTIVNYENSEDIKILSVLLYDFCVIAYSKIDGGFLTSRDAQSLAKKTKYVSIVWKDDKILACLLYEDRLGGKKATSGGAIPDNDESKNALQAIVRRDISNFTEGFWTEVSGAMEHYFKKHVGFPIPNIYAKSLLKNQNLELDIDKYHYVRELGLPDANGNRKTDKKCIFGFNSVEFYNEVINKFEEYASFRDYVISDDKLPPKQKAESSKYLFIENGMPEMVNDSIGYINYIEEMVYENGTNLTCMTPNMYSMLKRAVAILKDSLTTIHERFVSQISSNIEMGEDLLVETYPVEIHPISKGR